jgi:predicted nucleic acid-binding Zn ribbon protein
MAVPKQHRMERAGRILTRLRAARGALRGDQLAAAAWPVAVGIRLARRTRVVTLDRGKLIVEAEDELWQRNLSSLSDQILNNLLKHLGDAAPNSIEFRVGARRRPLRREETVHSQGLFAGTPSGIEDPAMDLIYRESRRKAGA